MINREDQLQKIIDMSLGLIFKKDKAFNDHSLMFQSESLGGGHIYLFSLSYTSSSATPAKNIAAHLLYCHRYKVCS